ncbi:MAG: hypothetical protein M1833_005864 [Piccolia ochrophora]|nr:MAG: hypothetical protein M1833_005864 [Piccolia ochrophora]
MSAIYPPTISLGPASRISPSEALEQIQRYLEAAKTTHSLHPDALLTERGPELASSSERGGLTLHHLRRVEAGLRGERISGEVVFGSLAEQEASERMAEFGDAWEHANGQGEHGEGQVEEGTELMNDEWQDLESYQQQQDAEVGELGDRHPGLGQGGEVPKVKDEAGKEERKKRKKERKREEKRRKEKERAG